MATVSLRLSSSCPGRDIGRRDFSTGVDRWQLSLHHAKLGSLCVDLPSMTSARSSVVDRLFFGQILVSCSWQHVQVWLQAIVVRGLPISASWFALSRIGLASQIFSSTPRWWHYLATTVPGSSGYIDDGTHPGYCGYVLLTSTFHKHEVL